MNTRKGLGHNCSPCHLSLSSNLSKSPSNCINHTHSHSALGAGLFVFRLVLFCFTLFVTSYKFYLQLRGLSSSLSLVIYGIPSHQPVGKYPPSLQYFPIYLSYPIPPCLPIFLLSFIYIRKILFHTYYVPILLTAL